MSNNVNLLSRNYYEITLIILSLFILILFLGTHPIIILDESKNAEAAREFIVTGQYMIPYFNGEIRVDKPPLHYYFMNLGYNIFGINSFGARFFSAIFGLFTIWLSFRFARKYFNWNIAVLTSLIFISSFLFIQEFKLAVPDPYLIFFISASLFSFYSYHLNRKRISLLLFYIFIGLGILTKGPIALFLIGVIVGIFLIVTKNIKKIFQYYPILGLSVIFLISSPWYINIHYLTDGIWTEGFFLKHNVSRFTNTMEGHGGSIFKTLGFILLGLFPFSIFIPQSLIHIFTRVRKQENLFLLIICSVFTLFFGISATKLPNYTMPSYPFFAMGIAVFLNYSIKKNKEKALIPAQLIIMIIGSLIPLIVYIYAINNEDVQYLLDHIVLLSFLFFGSIFSLFFIRKFKYWFIIIFVTWSTFTFTLNGFVFPSISKSSPVIEFKKVFNDKHEVIVYDRMDPSFPFNFEKIYKIVHSINDIEIELLKNPELLILTNSKKADSLESLENIELIFSKKAIFENNETKVFKLKNKKTVTNY